MSKGLNRSLARSIPLDARMIKQTIIVRDLALSAVGATGIGFGFAIAEDLPEGNILFFGAVCNLRFSGPGADANLSDTWVGDYSVGTVGTVSTTLTTTSINFIESTALAAATAEVSPVTRGVATTTAKAFILDNTDGSLEINISLLIDDTSIGGTVAMTVDGLIALSYVMLLDD